MSAARTPEEIRRSIEANRAELAVAVDTLRGEVTKAADWRAHLRAHQQGGRDRRRRGRLRHRRRDRRLLRPADGPAQAVLLAQAGSGASGGGFNAAGAMISLMFSSWR